MQTIKPTNNKYFIILLNFDWDEIKFKIIINSFDDSNKIYLICRFIIYIGFELIYIKCLIIMIYCKFNFKLFLLISF